MKGFVAAIRSSVCLCLLLLGGAFAQVDEECVANAVAMTAPDTASADALSNAVAETLTKSVACEEGASANPDEVGALSVAVALAISEANQIGQQCTADAEAAAEFATATVTDGIANTLLTEAEGDEKVLADAWLTARGPDVAEIIADSPSFLSEDGCLDLTALSMGLPTAVELGEILSDAIGQIVEAIQCGTNLEPSDEECLWADRMFSGKCLESTSEPTPTTPSPSPEPKTRTECRDDFTLCREEEGENCSEEFTTCFQAAVGCRYC